MGTWKNQPGWSPSSFNPESFEPQDLEPIDLTVTPEGIFADAYLDYTALLADGKITVGIHFGYDYNDQRYDISEARETYNQLVACGFQSPVENFEALEVDSGLFLGQVEADGRDIAVEIKLVHADMVDAVAEDNWRNRDVYFGVHGLDNDPKIHPFANLELLCTACSRDDDCGGQGNQCVKMVEGSKHCAPICLDDSGCPEETTCQNVAAGSYITTKACVPVGMSCNQPAPQSYTVMINEVLADPPPRVGWQKPRAHP